MLPRTTLRLAAAVFLAGLASAAASAAPPPVELPAPETTPTPTPTPTPAPAPLELPPAAAERQPAPAATPRTAAPVMAPPRDAAAATDDTITAPALPEPAAPLALPADTSRNPPPAPQAASSALGESMLPSWWPFAAGALAALIAVLGVVVAVRRRRPKVLRLAAPAKRAGQAADDADDEQAPMRLDCQLDILSATRSMMMFAIEYRLEIANRSPRAVRDLRVTTRLGYPGRTGEEAALVPTAEDCQAILRIGPHQSRSITGTLRLPLSEIAPIRQGAAPLLIPLLPIILESAGNQPETRLFVIGTPSPANLGRLQPIRLDIAPGGITGLRALPVNAR